MIKIEQGWRVGAQSFAASRQVNFSSRQCGLQVLPTCLEPRCEVTLARRSLLHQCKFVQVVEFVRLRMIGRLVLEPERVGKPDKKRGK